jgi:hypothetical protein
MIGMQGWPARLEAWKVDASRTGGLVKIERQRLPSITVRIGQHVVENDQFSIGTCSAKRLVA